MADGYVLSEKDKNILEDLHRKFNGMQKDVHARPVPDNRPFPNTDCYVAYTPVGGIPALSSTTTGTADDVPGCAECQIYKFRDPLDTTPDLDMIVGLNKNVFNLSGVAIAGNKWILVIREKSGAWVAIDVSSGISSSVLTVITDVCYDGIILTVKKRSVVVLSYGDVTTSTDPECVCDTAPDDFTITLTSSCADLDGVEVIVSYDTTQELWIGTATTDGLIPVEVRVEYSETNGWEVDIYYDDVLVISCTAEVTVCSPFEMTLTCIDGCFDCESETGTGSGGYTGGGSGSSGGNYTSPCCDEGVPLTLCLTSAVQSGSCTDLDAWSTLLTFDGTSTYTSIDTYTYCVSPFHEACNAMQVTPVLICGDGVWQFGFARDGYVTEILAELTTGDLCNGTPLVFDIAFDSTGATFPPGVDDGCCVATVRFTIDADLETCGVAATDCCPGGTPVELFISGDDGSSGTLTYDSGTFEWFGPNVGTGGTCGGSDWNLSCEVGGTAATDFRLEVEYLGSPGCAGLTTINDPDSATCDGNMVFFDPISGVTWTITP